jgi:Arc/MetJ family transcription regulator
MTIQIDIDDELLRAALQASDLPTEEDVIEEGLRIVIALSLLADLLDMFPLNIKHPPRH